MFAYPDIVQAQFSEKITTIRTLSTLYGLSEGDELTIRTEIGKVLDYFSLELVPALGQFDIDAERVLRRRADSLTLAEALTEIAGGETDAVEFKSSLLFDRNAFDANRDLPLHTYSSELVLNSSLKTVAAFCNSGGGSLYIGVRDNGSIAGLNADLELIGGKKDFDTFDLFFRSRINKYFIDGKVISSFVKIKYFDTKDGSIAKCVVSRLPTGLAFMKKDQSANLYIRKGTSSELVEFKDICKYFEVRRLE